MKEKQLKKKQYRHQTKQNNKDLTTINSLIIKQSTTHSLATPAFLTADETALIAVKRAFNKLVNSPVAPGNLYCSAKTKRVNVMQFVSIACEDDILTINSITKL